MQSFVNLHDSALDVNSALREHFGSAELRQLTPVAVNARIDWLTADRNIYWSGYRTTCGRECNMLIRGCQGFAVTRLASPASIAVMHPRYAWQEVRDATDVDG